jgi:hypothetical protein
VSNLKFCVLIIFGVVAASGAISKHCRADAFGDHKWNWKDILSETGVAIKIDLNSITHYSNGTTEAMVYLINGTRSPENLRGFWFDCQGHYRDQTGGVGPTLYAAPGSVSARLANVACTTARTPPTPDYCKGFSPIECQRVREGVEAKSVPAFCKADYPNQRLSGEQERICVARILEK